MKGRNLALTAAPYLFTIAFFLIWEVACRAFRVSSFILPPPSTIWAAMVQYQVPLLRNAFHTLWMTTVGFLMSVAFGIVMGLIVGSSRFLYAGLNPLLVGFNSIPKVAVVPILVIWFGVGGCRRC